MFYHVPSLDSFFRKCFPETSWQVVLLNKLGDWYRKAFVSCRPIYNADLQQESSYIQRVSNDRLWRLKWRGLSSWLIQFVSQLKKPLLSNSGNLVSSNQHNLLNYSQQNYDDCFPKKKQLQRKKFLFLTENNVILIPFTNVHCNFTEVKTLESKWNWLYFLYLWSYI